MNIEMEKPEMKKSHQRMEKRKKIERGKIQELEWDLNTHVLRSIIVQFEWRERILQGSVQQKRLLGSVCGN